MLLWVSFAILTAAVVALLLRPLRQAQDPAAVAPEAADLAVYRDQLKELEAERDRGLIAETELESARAEVARRLIKRSGDSTAESPEADADGTRARRIYGGVAALLPVLGIVLYLATGSPHLPAHPFAARQAAPETEIPIAALISRVEERLREHPEDGKGWDVIAPIYLRLGRYADAAHAFAEANRLEGESERRLLGFGEATLLAENGVVTEPVRTAALRVLQINSEHVQPQVWLALAREQDGDLAGAAVDYRKLLAAAPEDAPWRDAVLERLKLIEARIQGTAEGTPAPAPAPGATAPAPTEAAPSPSPSAAAPPAAEGAAAVPDLDAMSAEEQDAFVLSMVNRLAERLEDNAQDLDGWIRLARAYKVLGRDDDARAALTRARETFAGDAAALAEIARSKEDLGLGAKEEETTQ